MKSVESKNERGHSVTFKESIEEFRAFIANKSEALYLVEEKMSEVKKEMPAINTVEKLKCSKNSESEDEYFFK